jgi:RNA polymerase sigma-70 factor (ECF subfamily)
MHTSSIRHQALLDQARGGDREALGELLERHRPWLRLLAKRELGDGLDARVAPSDVVQQTFLSAFGNFSEFEGQNEHELLAWLKRTLQNNVRDAVRAHVHAERRTVDREERPHDGRPELSHLSSPSRRTMASEDAVRLAQCLEHLTDEQREAVRLRYLEGWPVARIAEQMRRTEHAVGGLLKRGLKQLRTLLQDDRTTDH